MGVFSFTVSMIAFACPYIYYSSNLGPMMTSLFGGTGLIWLLHSVGETTGRINNDIDQLLKRKSQSVSDRITPSSKSMAQKTRLRSPL
ncbi:hypothetical protein PENCOP_c006G01096 [Penicillium coprophilum]|uniref:Uncharacterized protein n=1 Tax=Penicillium coprophilum TaxID=36646 RepID=A0A1V6UPW0_9EURO|nr:hypothetical protein PENCOP_c006G01096 [Penicillium coprophilum]